MVYIIGKNKGIFVNILGLVWLEYGELKLYMFFLKFMVENSYVYSICILKIRKY